MSIAAAAASVAVLPTLLSYDPDRPFQEARSNAPTVATIPAGSQTRPASTAVPPPAAPAVQEEEVAAPPSVAMSPPPAARIHPGAQVEDARDVSTRALAGSMHQPPTGLHRSPKRASAPPAEEIASAVTAQRDARDASDPLQPLYAESARLEALVALVGGDRMASASSAVLTEELGARIAGIDAVLAQPDLPAEHRAVLWEKRVALLRQLAGIESTERWLAVHGQTFDDALVRVY